MIADPDPLDKVPNAIDPSKVDLSDGSVEQLVRFALQRRASGGCGSSIAALIEANAPASPSFWVEAAEELHFQKEHMDALECWRRALDLPQVKNDHVDLHFMGRELWAASGDGEDQELADQACRAFEKADDWEAVAAIRNILGKEVSSILDAIRNGLLGSDGLRWNEWQLGTLHYGTGMSANEIETWSGLAEIYINRGELRLGLDAWARAVEVKGDDDDHSILQSIVYRLVDFARKQNISDEDLIPRYTGN